MNKYGCGYGCAYRQYNLASQSVQLNDCQTGQPSGKITLHIYKQPTDQKLFLKAFSGDLFKMSPGGSIRGPADWKLEDLKGEVKTKIVWRHKHLAHTLDVIVFGKPMAIKWMVSDVLQTGALHSATFFILLLPAPTCITENTWMCLQTSAYLESLLNWFEQWAVMNLFIFCWKTWPSSALCHVWTLCVKPTLMHYRHFLCCPLIILTVSL